MVAFLLSSLSDVVVILWTHSFRDVGAGLLSGIFSDMALTVKMAGAENPLGTGVCGFVWCFSHRLIVLWRPWEVAVFGILVLWVIVA
jgi:hypothetical protein